MAEARICGVPIKWASLVLLTFVTTWTIFSIKLARSSSKGYENSSVVLCTELLKIILSFSLLSLETQSPLRAARTLWMECRSRPLELAKLSVPGLAYTIQNNLIFLSVDLLSAAVQQVTYQLKILCAALLSVLMIKKKVTFKQWISLFILVAGVILVQAPQDKQRRNGITQGTLGFLAALGACFASGFGGVYMEMVLKSSSSIWLRNTQLALCGASTAVWVVWREGNLGQITRGFTFWVWLMACTVASGGLLVAAVLKYADNILRQFSTAISVILTTALSALVLEDITLDLSFGVGTALVLQATFMYSGLLDRSLPSWML